MEVVGDCKNRGKVLVQNATGFQLSFLSVGTPQ